ncbi:C-C chemokine receptor type 9-like [Menidia menidia]
MDDLANSSWTSVDDIITALTTEDPFLTTEDYNYDYEVPDLLCDRSAGRLLRRRLEPPLFLLVALLGGLGNLAVVRLHLRRRGRGATELYLLQLAAADLLFLASLPLWAAEAAAGWRFGAALCRVNAALYKVNLFSGALLLAAISVDRYVVIVRGARGPGRRQRLQRGRLVCAAVWLLALVLATPELAFARVAPQGWAADGGGDGDGDAGALVCRLMPPPGLGNRTKVLVLALQAGAGCCLPALVMALCYGRVAATLLRSRGFQKHRALRVLAALVAAFLLTQLPFNGVLVLRAAAAAGQTAPGCAAQQALDRLHTLLRGVAYLHACLNPLLYAFLGRRFRRELLQLLPRACRRRPAAGVGGGKAAGGRSRSSSYSETSQALSL